jgi:MFS family permease
MSSITGPDSAEKPLAAPPRHGMLAPFAESGFRYQWPADLATSLAFDMEMIILAWYVLVETQSVTMLTIFASLQYVGTLIAPMFGVMGDRVGHRNVLAAMRGVYTLCALTLLMLVYSGWITPYYVIGIAAIMGLVRPSDVGMRAALMSDTMPKRLLVSAMGMQRSTQDMAKCAGALFGAGLVAWLGMGPAYCVVASFYAFAVAFTLKGGRARAAVVGERAPRTEVTTPWRDLKEGMIYVWRTPFLLATMSMALVLNFTAFPLMNSLMPIVAKEIYGTGQTGLSHLVAAGAFGAMLGSLFMGRIAHRVRPARMMTIGGIAWLAAEMVFAQTTSPTWGIPLIMLAGIAQAAGLVPMLGALLKNADPAFRGRIMGIRMLAIYTNIPGLLVAGPLVANFGYATMATCLSAFGIIAIVLIAFRWRKDIWAREAGANAR